MNTVKKKIAFLILCCITIALKGQNPVDKIYKDLITPSEKEIFVVAHRGDWRFAPENSLAAIESSIKRGVDIIEIDVKKTKDGEFILMHDITLDRTTTGKGYVKDWTLKDIKKLYLKNGAAIKTKHRVPTLKEALLLAKGKVLINLDHSYHIFNEIFPILEETGTTKQVILKGDLPVSEVKRDLVAYLDKIIYMPIIQLEQPNAIDEIKSFIKEMKPIAFELLYSSDTCNVPLIVKDMLKGKSRIWYNTLWDTMAGGHDDDLSIDNPDEGYGYLIDRLGATIIQTDRSEYLIDYLKSKNRK